MQAYCFPEESVIIYSWQKQSSTPRVSFRARGMNDAAFNILYDLIQKEEQVVATSLDLSYNDLSEMSVPKCFLLHQKKRLEIDLSHNRIDVSKISTEQRRFVETSTILPKSPSIEQSALCMDLPLQPPTALEREIKEISEQIKNVNQSVGVLSKTSFKYFDRIKEHEKFFEKIFKALESKISLAVQEQYKSNYGSSLKAPSAVQLQELANYVDEDNPTSSPTQIQQFDRLLISEDRKSLIIGEVKHNLTEKAFSQLKARKGFIEDLQDKISWLNQVEDIRILIGCEIFSQNLVDKCKKEKCIFVHPNHSRYQIEDFRQTQLQ